MLIVAVLGGLSAVLLVAVAVYVTLKTKKMNEPKPLLGVVHPDKKRGNKDA